MDSKHSECILKETRRSFDYYYYMHTTPLTSKRSICYLHSVEPRGISLSHKHHFSEISFSDHFKKLKVLLAHLTTNEALII